MRTLRERLQKYGNRDQVTKDVSECVEQLKKEILLTCVSIDQVEEVIDEWLGV